MTLFLLRSYCVCLCHITNWATSKVISSDFSLIQIVPTVKQNTWVDLKDKVSVSGRSLNKHRPLAVKGGWAAEGRMMEVIMLIIESWHFSCCYRDPASVYRCIFFHFRNANLSLDVMSSVYKAHEPFDEKKRVFTKKLFFRLRSNLFPCTRL